MYLNYFLYRNKIYLKYFDGTRPTYRTVGDYTPPVYMYASSDNTQTSEKTIFDQPLSRLNQDGDSIYDTKEMVKKYDTDNFPIFGYNKIANSYIYKTFKNQKVDFNNVHIKTIDIETECEDGFPNKSDPREKINIITCYSSRDKTYHSFYVNNRAFKSRGPVKFYQYDDEESMLRGFIEWWGQDYADILTGWNVEGFDVPYLFSRIKRILGEEAVKKLSPFGLLETREEKNPFGGVELKVDIRGMSVVDYLPLYKKYSKKVRESYRLDFIAKAELKEQKLKHSSGTPGHLLYREHFEDFIKYNIQDVRLIVKLEEKLKMIYLVMVIAYTAFINFDDIFSNMRILDNLIYTFLVDQGMYFRWDHRAPMREQFDGGAVKETIPGKYRWVASFDVTSEYPSLIRAMNISPETITPLRISTTVDGILDKKYDLSRLQVEDITMAANGTTYRRDKTGFMAEVVKMLFRKRKEYKNKKVEADKAHDKDLSLEFDTYQNAYKVMLNSLYGIMGNVYFRFYDLRFAEGITHSGQALVKWVMNDINKALQRLLGDDKDRCVASDTDSVYFCFDDLVRKKFGDKYSDDEALAFVMKFSDENVNDLIEKSIANFAKYMNCYEPEALDMKREIISDDSIFIAKKRYIMSVLNKEGAVYERGDEIKITGVEAVKSSTPEVCRDTMEDAFKVLLFGTEDEYNRFIQEFYRKFKSLSMDEIAENKSVSGINKYLDSRGNMLSGVPINSRAAIVYNKLVEEMGLGKIVTKIRENDKIKHMYMKMPNPLRQNVFGWINSVPEQMEHLKDFADYDLQFEKTFRKALDPIARLAGIRDQNAADANPFL